jgi:hypothetical protein
MMIEATICVGSLWARRVAPLGPKANRRWFMSLESGHSAWVVAESFGSMIKLD